MIESFEKNVWWEIDEEEREMGGGEEEEEIFLSLFLGGKAPRGSLPN